MCIKTLSNRRYHVTCALEYTHTHRTTVCGIALACRSIMEPLKRFLRQSTASLCLLHGYGIPWIYAILRSPNSRTLNWHCSGKMLPIVLRLHTFNRLWKSLGISLDNLLLRIVCVCTVKYRLWNQKRFPRTTIYIFGPTMLTIVLYTHTFNRLWQIMCPRQSVTTAYVCMHVQIDYGTNKRFPSLVEAQSIRLNFWRSWGYRMQSGLFWNASAIVLLTIK